jgi:hypothetical protein
MSYPTCHVDGRIKHVQKDVTAKARLVGVWCWQHVRLEQAGEDRLQKKVGPIEPRFVFVDGNPAAVNEIPAFLQG